MHIPVADDRPINFIEQIWHYLSPFSAHKIKLWGHEFPTVEHAYHWARFKPGFARDGIMTTPSPEACLHHSRNLRKTHPQEILENFDKDAVMEEIFRAKLAQHPHLVEVLKLTGKRALLKEIGDDEYWGVGHDGGGQNKMGKLWMKLRAELV
jgi:ribA/ribD-fused uncharacterized protein